MDKSHISLRIPTDALHAVDKMVFDRRLRKAPGRSATRAAVIIDLITRSIERERATEGSIKP